MKKLLLSILTFLYMMVSTGIAMEVHYCMGKQAGIEFYGSKDDVCGKCGMLEKKGGCCSNEHKFFKFEDSFKHASNEINFVFFNEAITAQFSSFTSNEENYVAIHDSFYESPPKIYGPTIYIRNCIFRL